MQGLVTWLYDSGDGIGRWYSVSYVIVLYSPAMLLSLKDICADILVGLTEESNFLRKIVANDETSLFQQTQENVNVSNKWVHGDHKPENKKATFRFKHKNRACLPLWYSLRFV
jgi:hypothetical protein